MNHIPIEQRIIGAARWSPLKIIAIYVLMGGLWILFSDHLLATLIKDLETLTQFQTYKGWFYIMATAWILYLLMGRYSSDIQQYINGLKKAEEELQESQIRYRKMFENASDAIYLIDPQTQTILDCNIKAAEMDGYSVEELKQMTVLSLHPPDERDLLPNKFKEVMAKGSVTGISGLHRARKDGRIFPVEVNATMVELGGRAVNLSTVRDVTDRVQSESALQQKINDLTALHNTSKELVGQVSVEKVLKSACRLAAEGFGLKMSWLGLVTEEDFDVHPAAFWGMEEGYLRSIRVTRDDAPTGQGPTGTAIRTGRAVAMNRIETDPAYAPWREEALKRGYRSSAALPLLQGDEVLGALNVYSAETEFFTLDRLQVFQSLANLTAIALQRARLYEQAQSYAVELEQRVAARTSELDKRIAEAEQLNRALANLLEDLQETNRRLEETTRELELTNRDLEIAREKAESADRVKSAFLAAMSHELRTPLNSIIGFTGILLQGMGGPLTDEQTRQLGMVRNGGRHLLSLINDVLDISKIEAGQLKLEIAPFGIREAIEKVAGTIANMAEKKGVGLLIRIGPGVGTIVSDQRRVGQILINLISNAVKFTPAGGEICVAAEQVSTEQGTKNFIEISVEDPGIGIKPEDINTLFKPFQQIDTGLTRKFEGTGLGLSICKRLVEMLGGEIRVESEGPGKGSTFAFTLPVGLSIDDRLN